MDIDQADAKQDLKSDSESISKLLGWDLLHDEIDERAASITLADIDLSDGDLLDCVIKPDPTLAIAPNQGRPAGRDRPSDRYGHSRR